MDRGIIRILDIAFVAKGQDGSVSAVEVDGGLASGRIPVQAILASLGAVEARN